MSPSNTAASNGSAAAAHFEWDADMLTGRKEVPNGGATTMALSPAHKKRLFRRGASSKDAAAAAADAALWGVPGHLTDDEAAVYLKFKAEMDQRGDDFRSTIFSFGDVEEEAYTLCRWLRARKFVLEDVLTMVTEATECRAKAKEEDFYPNVLDALGCETSLYYLMYPQLYTGCAKNGAPLFISKPGILHVDGMECITTLDGIIKFHWHVMMHDFAAKLRTRSEEDPHFKKFECFCVLDLAHLTTSQLGSRAMAIIKEQTFIDSLCFPETMSKMIIVNAPRFFTAFWKLIRGWLDARTASKIEVLSNRASWEKRLNELIDSDKLPSDYGGTGPSTDAILATSNEGGMTRLEKDMLYVRGHGSSVIEVAAHEELEIQVWTRSTAGAKFTVTTTQHHHGKKDQHHDGVVPPKEVKHHGTDDVTESPTHVNLNDSTARIVGPTKIKVKADSHAGRFTTANFLLVYRFFEHK